MISVIIPAAGHGVRMEQNEPKALTPFAGAVFLELQIRKFAQFADQVLVVISSEHLEVFEKFRKESGLKFEILIQLGGKGTYFAVKSAISRVKHNFVVIAWADQIGISSSLISRVCSRVLIDDCQAVVPLFFTQDPYVRALLSESREIIGWEYQREGDKISEGFTDLGLFAFSTNRLKNSLLDGNEEELPLTSLTREISFLDFIATFAVTNKVVILETFDKLNTIGINNQEDLNRAEKSLRRNRSGLKFSIIIPSYNEGPRLPTLLESLNTLSTSYSSRDDVDLEVIFVDDGSQDNTRSLVVESNFVYLFQENQGKGSAVKNGVGRSTGDYVLVLDADGEYRVDDIHSLINSTIANPNAAVYGSRYLTNSKLGLRLVPISNQSCLNLYFNYLLSVLIKIRFGIFISDSLTGFKVYPREVYLTANPTTMGFETDHELTRKIILWKLPIIEVPVSYFPRRKSEGKKITSRDAFKALGIWLS